MAKNIGNSTIPYIDGVMHSGQSTFGDMNMHLGFISSIANQKRKAIPCAVFVKLNKKA